MNLLTPRQHAIKYCLWLRIDPHATVGGYIDGQFVQQVRWQWYLGARVGQ